MRGCEKNVHLRKIWMTMKLTTFLFFLAITQIVASEAYSQTTKMTLQLSDATVKEVLSQIEEKSEFFFLYNSKLVDVNRKVSVDAKDERIEEILNGLFQETGVVYTVVDRQIVLTNKADQAGFMAQSNQQQGKKVTGKVTDSSGASLPGVAVVVKGTTAGVVTDNNGTFSLANVPENATLQFSFVGMKMQEVATGNKTTINITLADETIGIEEVVAVGYGTQRKATITGAVAAIKGAEFNVAPVSNASNALAGRISGLVTYQRSGEPGNDGTTIRIRGINTLGDNSPLIVVDGVPGRSLDRIDPSTIENVSVLKDASAAIYGSRAANGVILITTKRGTIGKSEVIVNFNQGFTQPTRIPKMANSSEYATMLNEIDTYRNQTPRYSSDEIQKFSNGSDPWKYPDTDFFSEVLKPWSKQNNLNASLSGGSENMKYYVSLGSIFQDGYYQNSGTFYKQYDFRSNLDGKISKDIKISFDVAGRMEYRNYPTRGSGAIYRMVMRGKPIYPGYWPNGMPGPDLEYGDNPVVVSTDATGYDKDKRYILNSNMKLDINIPWVNGLKVSTNVSLDKDFQFRKRFETPWYLYSWDGVTYDNNKEPVLNKGKKGFDDPRLSEWMKDNYNLLINGLVNYEKIINRHNINLMAGMESIEGNGENFNAYRRYFISTSIDQMFAGGDKDKNNGGSGWETARLNYFGRLNYNFDEKLLMEFVWRYDGSYIFPKGKRYGFFPGVSLGWRMSEEKFWKENLSFINDFKLRGSWGQTGNDRIDEWQYLATYGMNPSGYTTIFGVDQENKLLSEGRVPNKDVTWEVANQANIGFDAYLLNNKLFLTFDVFDNKRSNILWQRNASVPASTGLSLPRENIGKVKNQGFDFNLSYQNKSGDLSYAISLNGGYAKNKITYWDESPGAPEWQTSTGKPIPTDPNNVANDIYYEAIGIFSNQTEIDNYPHWNGARPGDIIFRDVNDDKKIDGNDMVRNEKNNVPRFTGGLNLKLGYKQFDFSVLFQGAAGAVAYIQTESGEIGNFTKDYFDNRWTAQNPNATGPRTNASTAEYWLDRNTYFLHNTDYLRLKNLELGYSLPSKLKDKMGIKGLRIYMSGYNLMTFSPGIKDFDPEMDDTRAQGYPVQRVVNFGVNLNF